MQPDRLVTAVQWLKLGDLAVESRERNNAREVREVRSVTSSRKLIPTNEVFENVRTSEDTSQYKVVRPGAFAYNPSRINVGSVASNEEPEPVIVSPMYVVFGLDTDRIRSHYLAFYLSTATGSSQLVGRVETGARFRLTFSALSGVPIPVPSVDYQDRCVIFLESLLDLSQSIEREINLRLSQMGQYLDALVGQMTASGHLPKVSLLEALKEPLANGRSVPDGDGYPVLRLGALQGEEVDLTHSKPGAWTADQGRRFKVEQGDILLARGNGSPDRLARPSLVTEAAEVAFPDTMIRLRVDTDRVSSRFLMHVLNSRTLRQDITSMAKASSGIWKVSQADLERLRIPLPTREVQDELVGRVGIFNDLLDNLRNELVARREQFEYYRDMLLTFEEDPA